MGSPRYDADDSQTSPSPSQLSLSLGPKTTRPIPAKCGVWNATASLVMTAIGSGIFAVPEQFKLLGWLPATILLAVTAIICAFGAHITHKAAYLKPGAVQDVAMTSFAELGSAAYGFAGGVVCELSLHGIMVMVASILLFIMGVQLKVLTATSVSHSALCCIIAALALPLAIIPSMKNLELVSACGIFSLFVLLLLFSGFCIIQLAEEGIAHTELVGSNVGFSECAGAFSTFVFSFGAASLVPALEQDCYDPRVTVKKAINRAYVVMVSLYTVVCVLGYMAYGEDTKDNLLDTLTEGRSEAWRMVIGVFVMILGVTHYVVILAPIGKSAERFGLWLFKAESTLGIWATRFFLRSSMVVITAITAAFVTSLGSIVALAGSTFGMCLLFFVAPLCYAKLICVKQQQDLATTFKNRRGEGFGLLVCLVFGLYGFIVGTYSSVYKL